MAEGLATRPYFRSKAEAFRAAMVAGLDEVRLAVAGLKSQQPSG